MASQGSYGIVNFVSKLSHRDTWPGDSLHVLANLTMDFCSFAIVAQEFIVHVAHCRQVTDFFSRGTLKIVVLDGILDDLAFWKELIVPVALSFLLRLCTS
jgi:hypothetical protein